MQSTSWLILLALLLNVPGRAQDKSDSPARINPSSPLAAPASAMESRIGQADPNPAPVHGERPRFAERYPRYELRAGDVLDLAFEFSPEFNQNVSVQPDGFVSLRGIGDVHVAGQTVPEVRRTISSAYAAILKDPVLSIVLKDFEKPYFVASGEVTHPGKYELRGDTTVTQAIAIAGGFNDEARRSQVVLYRHVSRDTMEAQVVDLGKMFHDKDLREDLHLSPGDMIYIQRSGFSRFKRFIPAPGVGMGVDPTHF